MLLLLPHTIEANCATVKQLAQLLVRVEEQLGQLFDFGAGETIGDNCFTSLKQVATLPLIVPVGHHVQLRT